MSDTTSSATKQNTQNHYEGVWLTLRRVDTTVKYLQLAALITFLVIDRMHTEFWEHKYLWWGVGITLLLNFFMQSVHMFLYYVVNPRLDDKFYWPRVFPKEWQSDAFGTGYSQHYKVIYVVKALTLAYLGTMIFQEKLDMFFVYVMYGITVECVLIDLCYYLFDLR